MELLHSAQKSAKHKQLLLRQKEVAFKIRLVMYYCHSDHIIRSNYCGIFFMKFEPDNVRTWQINLPRVTVRIFPTYGGPKAPSVKQTSDTKYGEKNQQNTIVFHNVVIICLAVYNVCSI